MALMQSYNYGGILKLLNNNVAEFVFRRRHPKQAGYSSMYRRIFCTLDRNLLNSIGGRTGLHFTPPTQPPVYIAAQHNLIVVWDIIMQDWRSIPLEALEAVNIIPSHTKQQQDEFWKIFEVQFKAMTRSGKKQWMNS